ncbi:MAG TPA: carboxylesterase family protein [Actinomycetota bacterium]|nr:carboxylesterase family protein [Actinomycetota bacterium]
MTEPNAPTWECHAGTIVGWRDDGVLRATGIPYARAGRYQPPVAEPPCATPVPATSWAPACPQAGSPLLDEVLVNPMGDLVYDEDCLRLSVTTPADVAAGESLPVMVWIHGGSYTVGAGDAPVFDAGPLVREQRVIVVAVTYRLGLLGFLGVPGRAPANLGLLDMLEALRWVQRNIAAFGGDPSNVTAFGQSAGADAIAHLMIADGAAGLFRRAIIESAPLGISRGRAGMNRAMAQAASRTPAGAPVEDLIGAQENVAERAQAFGLPAAMPFGTQYGNVPLPPAADAGTAWERVAPEIDVLIGHTSREAALYVSMVPAVATLVDRPVLGPIARSAFVAALTRKVYTSAEREFATRHRRAGGHGYRYKLTWQIPGNPYRGAHIVDMPLLFGRREAWEGSALVAGAAWDEVEARGRQLRGLWAGFARHGQVPVGEIEGLIDVRPI